MTADDERRAFVTWYTPEEKLPPDGEIVIATISGKNRNVLYDHAFSLAEHYEGDGWYTGEIDTDLKNSELTVHAWCDLEPYGAKDARANYPGVDFEH